MTERKQQYIDQCHRLLEQIKAIEGGNDGKVICVNALSQHIREMLGIWSEPTVSRSEDKATLIGLTFADIVQLQNGGTIEISKENLGEDFGITIFLGGTHEQMAEGLKKHPGTKATFFDSHGQQKN